MAQGINLPLARIICSYSGGLFFSLFLPSTIGGDVARSVDLGLHTKRHSVVMATVLLDRLSGFVGLVLIAITMLIFGHKLIDEPAVYFTVCSLAALLTSFLLLIFNKKIYKKLNYPGSQNTGIIASIRRLHSEIYFFRGRPLVLIYNLVYSIIIQAGACFVAYFILRGLSVNINMIYPLVLNPVIVTITTLPISIGGLGLRDASSIFFYTKVGVAKDAAFAQSLLIFSLAFIFGLIGGVIYVATLRYRRLQPDQTVHHSKQNKS